MSFSVGLREESLAEDIFSLRVDAFEGKEPEVAEELKDLPSISGLKFFTKEEFWLGYPNKVKIARTDHKLGIPEDEEIEYDEWAYHCPYCRVWIQGLPLSRGYNDPGPLSGSKGVEFLCVFCCNVIGSLPTKVS